MGSERDPRAQAPEGTGLGGRKTGLQAAARGWEDAPPTCVLCGAGGDVSPGQSQGSSREREPSGRVAGVRDIAPSPHRTGFWRRILRG